MLDKNNEIKSEGSSDSNVSFVRAKIKKCLR